MGRFGRMANRFLVALVFRGVRRVVGRKMVALRTMPIHQNRCMGHPALVCRGGRMGLEKRAVVLRTMPTSQNRDMGHPVLWGSGRRRRASEVVCFSGGVGRPGRGGAGAD